MFWIIMYYDFYLDWIWWYTYKIEYDDIHINCVKGIKPHIKGIKPHIKGIKPDSENGFGSLGFGKNICKFIVK